MVKHVLSFSGGKDSTAMYLLAMERAEKRPNFRYEVVFADTGNEHEAVYAFVESLPILTGGPPIRTVTADFTNFFGPRRIFIRQNWPEDLVEQALEVFHPSGNPFIDLTLLKGRFPSSRARFCTEELKVMPILKQIYDPHWKQGHRVISWQGVRKEESYARSLLPMFQWISAPKNYSKNYPAKALAYRPILEWLIEDVWAIHKKHGVKRNRLYDAGFGRVGCFPCIMGNKKEIATISQKFPEHIDRLERWEQLVSKASKRGCATFFSVITDPIIAKRVKMAKAESEENPDLSWLNQTEHGIRNIVEWSHTSHGGKQMTLGLDFEAEMQTSCNQWGACE